MDMSTVSSKIKSKRCTTYFKRSFGKVSILPMLKVIIEVLNVLSKNEDKPTKSNSLAWTVFDIFSSNSLREGKWKVKLFRPPVNKSLNLSSIRQPENEYLIKIEFFLILALKECICICE